MVPFLGPFTVNHCTLLGSPKRDHSFENLLQKFCIFGCGVIKCLNREWANFGKAASWADVG